MKSELNVVGIMNGTSLDGLDYVLCRITKNPFKVYFIDQVNIDFPPALRKKLLKCIEQKATIADVTGSHFELGKTYSDHLLKIKKEKKWEIDLIGLHGQTIYHAGNKGSFQIGEPSYLSQLNNVDVVNQFRNADIALGGQGAPLLTYFHWVLAEENNKFPIAFQNIGGIGNVTFIDKISNELKILSFDTGPGNILINLIMEMKFKKHFDFNGDIAKKGIASLELVNKWLKQKYFLQKPPKSTGRELFNKMYLIKCIKEMKKLNKFDQVATITELTAKSISDSYRAFCPEMPRQIFLCGGGAKNNYLIKRISFHLPECQVQTTQSLDWPVDSIEGAGFALMAACNYWGISAHFPNTTGATKQALLGNYSKKL